MKLPKGTIARMGPTPSGYLKFGGSPKFHFPDGNATFARLLVRRLVPGAIPGIQPRTSSPRAPITAGSIARTSRCGSA